MKKLYIGVIGVGYLGSKHAKTYTNLENVNLVGICDTIKKEAKK